MTEWILILVFTFGSYGTNGGKGISSLLVPSFSSEQTCKDAGTKSMSLAQNVRFVCVEQKKGR